MLDVYEGSTRKHPEKWLTLIALISHHFWDGQYRVKGRQIRHLHSNPSNWPLIPYMPKRYRDPSKKQWGRRLLDELREAGKMELYRKYCACRICGLP